MFGMLDYRAHKLYILLFFVPNLILGLFAMFGLPLIHYSIGLALADERIFQILVSLIAVFIIESIWLLIVFGFISKAFQFIFELFIDVIPDNGRTKEEAQMVVWSGDKAIKVIAIGKHPSTWNDELIDGFSKNDWVQHLLYKDKVSERMNAVFDEYSCLPTDSPYDDYEIARILKEQDIEMTWQEKFLSNIQIRRAVIGYSFFLILLIYNPFG
jgi:hypothetical protein